MSRVEQLMKQLDDHSASLIVSPQNRRYLTGFPSSAGCVLVTKEKSYFLTDFRYIEAAQLRIRDMDCIEYQGMLKKIRELLEKHSIRRLQLESKYLTIRELKAWEAALTGFEIVVDDALDEQLRKLRLFKSKQEVAKIVEAQRLSEQGFTYILDRIRPGATEREIALDLEFYIRRQGAEAASFEFIVVSGVNSSMPHGVPTDKKIESGDFVTMDFGAVVDGWHSDMTRTVAVGSISDEQTRVYHTVLQAQQACLDAVRPGLSLKAGDAAARDVIAQAGYGKCFGHATGHGVGLDIHEEPVMAPKNEKELLEPGMVVTVEPGIYLPGKFGVRIEDMVYVTEQGCDNLTKAPKHLIIL